MGSKQIPRVESDIVLEAIVGPMFSGKTEDMMRRLGTLTRAGLKVVIIRPSIDIRGVNNLVSHGEMQWKGSQVYISVDKPERAIDVVLEGKHDAVGFDECQFYPNHNIVTTLLKLAHMPKRVIATMLDMDFRGLPYGFAPQIMAVSTSITKLSAICQICKRQPTRTQRLNDAQEPVAWNDALTVVGGEKVVGSRYYQARCTEHHIVVDENGKRVIVFDSNGKIYPWKDFSSDLFK